MVCVLEILACENIRFSSLFAAGDVSRGGTSPVAKSEEKRMFSQAMEIQSSFTCSHLHWPRGAITQRTNCVTFYLLTQLLISTKKTCTS